MSTTQITSTLFEELRAELRGTLLEPHDTDFTKAVQGWSLGHQHHPAAVLIAQDANDVVAAVQFAQVYGLPIATQSTGHGFVRAADGALLVNVSQLNKVEVDPLTQTATVQAGATWAQVLSAAHAHGLTGLVGDTPSVGAVGYTLGGGLGWFGRKYGLGCDALLEARVVTMDGILRTVSAEETPELFWGLRGGTGGLGIVTEMTIQLYPENTVTAAQIIFPLEAARDAVRTYRDWTKNAPDEVSSRVMVMHGPDVEFLPPFIRGRTAIMLQAVYSGSESDAQNAFQDLLNIPGSIAKIVERIAPPQLGQFFGAPPAPTEAVGRSEQLSELSNEAIEAMLSFAELQPAPFYLFEIRHLGGAIANVADDATAFAHRNAAFLVNYHALVFAPTVREVSNASVTAFTNAIQPFVTGKIMPNFLNGDEGIERDRAAHPGLKQMHLAMLKARFDPANLLRFARTPGSRPA
jgi:FAD/FMN-containing dehydrogenase